LPLLSCFVRFSRPLLFLFSCASSSPTILFIFFPRPLPPSSSSLVLFLFFLLLSCPVLAYPLLSGSCLSSLDSSRSPFLRPLMSCLDFPSFVLSCLVSITPPSSSSLVSSRYPLLPPSSLSHFPKFFSKLKHKCHLMDVCPETFRKTQS
jgi:hypothetical protein